MFTAIKEKIQKVTDKRSSLQKAIDWIKRHRIPGSGIVVHHKTTNVTEEVTGYIINSLYRAGEKDLAIDLAKWEMAVQREDGAFVGPGTKVPYTFDTAQVVRGLLAVADDLPVVKMAIIKACDFIVTQIDTKGEVHTPNADLWSLPDGNKLSEYCNLYVLSPLRDAGKKYGFQNYLDTVTRALNFYKSKPDLTEFKSNIGTLSHIFGYMMEALVELNEIELAKRGLQQAYDLQWEDGSIPAYPGVDWVCSTGLAQLGIAAYKIGDKDQAQKALSYLEKIQNASGGFYGGYGEGVQYFPLKEISWAAKYFIDLYLLVRGKDG